MEEGTSQPRKSIFKHGPKGGPSAWFWAIIILFVLAIAFIVYKAFNDDKGMSGLGKLSKARDIPACPADTSQIFTKPFMDGDKPDFIVPLGNSQISDHVIPVDHVYPNDQIKGEVGPVYAPGDMTLIRIENKQTYNKNTNEKMSPDFQLNFAPCRGINLAFIHIMQLSDKLKSALEQPEDSNCDLSNKIDYKTRSGQSSYYVTCHPKFRKIAIQAGELIGYFGYKENENVISGFDIGLYDYNKPALGFINPKRYYADTNYTACFTDYYTSDLKAKYEAKFSGGGSNGQITFRTTPPVCGKVMWDVAGTASGSWFKNPIRRDYETDDDALVFLHDNFKPELGKLSVNNITSFTFTPAHSGTINREPSEVKADGKIYCYQNDGETFIDASGRTVPKENVKNLIQLIDNTHIKYESQPGTCTASESFKSPLTYER